MGHRRQVRGAWFHEARAGPAAPGIRQTSTLPLRLAAADTVVFVDLPARTCLRGIVARRLRTGGGQDPTTGVYDRLTWEVVRYVLGYRRRMRPRVRRLLAEHPTARVVTLTSRRAVRRFLRSVPSTAPAGR